MSSLAAKHDLTTGNIRAHLMRMTLPMIWGVLSMISFQLVNTWYISRLGTVPLAAMSYTFPVTYGLFSLFIGFSIAMSSVVSRLIGQKQFDDIKRITAHGMILILGVCCFLTGAGLLLTEPIFRAMGVTDEMMPLIHDYMVPYFFGLFFISTPIIGNAALRASGDTRIPALIMVTAALANAAIDPILIFGLFGFPRLEIQGAAISTVFANACALMASLLFLRRKQMIDARHLRSLTLFGDSARKLLIIALPAGLTSALPAISNAVITTLLTGSGAAAVAAFGVASRIEAFAFIIVMALAIGLAPIVGQNWGGGFKDRVRETVFLAALFSAAWSILVALLLGVFEESLSAAFSKDETVRDVLALYLVIVPVSYAFGSVTNIWGSAYNAMGEPRQSATMLFAKMIVLLIPAVWLGEMLAGAAGVFFAIAAINILTGVLFHAMGLQRLRRAK
jgi:putative MATE family efflux protein